MYAPVIVLATAIVAAAPVSAGQVEIDGCALIKVLDVEEVMGAPLKWTPRIVRRTLAGIQNYGCTYKSENYEVMVRLETGRTKDDVELYLKLLGVTVKKTTSSNLRPISGIGDRAWWSPVNPTNGIVTVVRGTDILWVQTYGKAPGAGSLEKTRKIMDYVFQQYLRLGR